MSDGGKGSAAQSIDYDGASARICYGDPRDEYAALDGGAGVLDFSRRRFIRATGEERVEFLQGQLSADIGGLVEGGGCAALLLTGQGRVAAMLRVYRRREDLLLATNAACLAGTRKGLELHLVADDCEFENLSPAPAVGVVGPLAESSLRQAGFEGHLDSDGYSISEGRIAGTAVTVLGRGCLRVPCFEVCGTAQDEFQAVVDQLVRQGAVRAGVEAYECLRVESGVARYGVDIDDGRLALEARLRWAIHFAKGCYLGQEVIERAVSRGKLKRRLSLIALEAPVVAGDRVAGGAESERITSVVESPRLGPIGFAYVADESSGQGSRIEIQTGQRTVAATVLAWPRSDALEGR